ncbi:hypothetical protein BS78_05G246000 [Paspalum vaginatum]|nr:hypothetical protein BS78_05G246000 [Paspalum vaginatum]
MARGVAHVTPSTPCISQPRRPATEPPRQPASIRPPDSPTPSCDSCLRRVWPSLVRIPAPWFRRRPPPLRPWALPCPRLCILPASGELAPPVPILRKHRKAAARSRKRRPRSLGQWCCAEAGARRGSACSTQILPVPLTDSSIRLFLLWVSKLKY